MILYGLDIGVVLLAYADAVLLMFTDPGDLRRMHECQAVNSATSSARINATKCFGLKQGIRRAKRSHKMTLADRIKENPKAFYSYIRNKRVVREKSDLSGTKVGNYAQTPKK